MILSYVGSTLASLGTRRGCRLCPCLLIMSYFPVFFVSVGPVHIDIHYATCPVSKGHLGSSGMSDVATHTDNYLDYYNKRHSIASCICIFNVGDPQSHSYAAFLQRHEHNLRHSSRHCRMYQYSSTYATRLVCQPLSRIG